MNSLYFDEKISSPFFYQNEVQRFYALKFFASQPTQERNIKSHKKKTPGSYKNSPNIFKSYLPNIIQNYKNCKKSIPIK